jgi:N-acetylglucosamine-6-phosphate deacetylase
MRLGVRGALVDGAIVRGDVAVEDGVVVAVGLGPPGRDVLAVPGFVDVQVNGFGGVDAAAADLDGYAAMAAALARTGVTAFQPTLVSLPEAAYAEPLAAAAAAAAKGLDVRLLGVHLEGPFLAPGRHGAHDPRNLVAPDRALARRLVGAGPVTHVTVAPELPGALDLIDDLVAAGVTVACGHSDADAETAHAAFDRGARAVTHLFNAMRPFGHRDPGIGGAALARPGVVVTVIADGVHLADETLAVVQRATRGRLALVTDAIAAAGIGDGSTVLGDRTVEVRGMEARLADGTLAGSVVTMDHSVRLLHAAGASLEDAAGAATRVPAALARHPELGTLAPGSPADVTVLDDALHVTRTLLAGRETHAA